MGSYYHADSPFNTSSKLHGPVQTSYQAEVRALLHALQTAEVPTCVFVDCQSVVNLANKCIEGNDMHIESICEKDLWERIFNLVNCSPTDFYKIQRMPSHLNDPDKAEQRKRALESCIICEADIAGNDEADKLARDGALMHPTNE